MLFFRHWEHSSYFLNHAALVTTFQIVIGAYLPEALKKSLSVKHPHWRKILSSLITVDLQVVTLWWEPQPLKQADLLHLYSELINQQPVKYLLLISWMQRHNSMALVLGSQTHHSRCGSSTEVPKASFQWQREALSFFVIPLGLGMRRKINLLHLN